LGRWNEISTIRRVSFNKRSVLWIALAE